MRNDWFMYVTSCCVIFLITLLICTQVHAETNTVSNSTVTVDKSPSSANSPSINSVNSFICRSGVSGAVQTQILGISSGMTIIDVNCERLLLSQTLYKQGLKVASVSILCQDKRVFIAMQNSGTSCPVYDPVQKTSLLGQEAQDYWEANPHLRPDYEDIKEQIVEEKKQEGTFDDIKDFGLLALSMLVFL